jgi:hypothetical protein
MQPGRGLGLALEAFLERRFQEPGERQHLQGHVPAERLLLCLVHHPHAALPNLAQEAVAAQPLRQGRRGRSRLCQLRSGPLHRYQRRQQLADLLRQFGIALGVFAHRGTFAGPIAPQKGLRHRIERVLILVGSVHACSSPNPPGMEERTSLIRCKART